jgi:hypothetical protein
MMATAYTLINDNTPGPRLRRFSDYTADNARQILLRVRQELDALGYEENYAFMAGDHWQASGVESRQWRGPRPQFGSNYASVWAEIKRGFVSKNVVKEVVERHKYAVAGREPMWSLRPRRALGKDEKPTPQEDALIKEATAALIAWWDLRAMLLVWHTAIDNLLLAGRAPLRLFVPPDRAAAGQAKDLLSGLTRVYLQALDPDQACLYTDTLSMRDLGVYEYTDPASNGGDTFLELSYLDEQGHTVLRTVTDTDTVTRLKTFLGLERVRPGTSIDLGGGLFVVEMRREPLITEQVRQNQGLVNTALTMLPRNVILAGFREDVYLNAQRPTKRQLVAGSTTEYEEVEVPLQKGAGVTTFASGLTYTDEQGNTRIMPTDWKWRDPVPVKTMEDTARIGRENILDETHQKHAKHVGNAEVGAESLKESREEFRQSLKITKLVWDAAGREVLESALRLGAFFAGQQGRYDSLRVSFDSRFDVGSYSSEETRMGLEQVKQEVLSRQTFMSRHGIDDPDAEISLIDSDMSLEAQNLRLDIAKKAQELGAQDGTVKRLGGLPEGEALTPPADTQTDERPNGDSEVIQ